VRVEMIIDTHISFIIFEREREREISLLIVEHFDKCILYIIYDDFH
jgi:hypothetical protein